MQEQRINRVETLDGGQDIFHDWKNARLCPFSCECNDFGKHCCLLFPMQPWLRSALQHFAAGTVFAAVAAELLPDVMSHHAPLATVLGFLIGVTAMLLIRAFTARLEQQKTQKQAGSAGLLTAIGVDITIDGLLIGIGFAAGARQGLLLTVALTLELLSLGLATATSLQQKGATRLRSSMTTSLLALLVLVGAMIGLFSLTAVSGNALAVVLSFGVAALLYLVTEELLVEAHEVPETTFITSVFFLGFLAILLLDLVT